MKVPIPAEAVAIPSFSPAHVSSVTETVTCGTTGPVMIKELSRWQFRAVKSVTVTEYVPAPILEMFGVVKALFQKYEYAELHTPDATVDAEPLP